jgi:CO/xanthine dehydrogenase Mo-binding subunit
VTSNSTVGKPTPQINAWSKVLGKAQYAGDINIPGMLHGKVLRSPFPHAKIVSIDTSRARALGGVKAVICGREAPETTWGARIKDRCILARDTVRFAGEEVVAVAAVTEDLARDALDLIEIEYEELPALLTPEQSLSPDAVPIHSIRGNNVAHEVRYERGTVDAALATSYLVHEATYSTHSQYPGYLEPMATVAMLDASGRLNVWTSTQTPHMVRGKIASVLGIPVSMVRVVQATTGGSFGGKIVEDANSLIASILAVRTGAPVRLVNNRLEDFLACPTSVPETIWLRVGMDRQGRILAKDMRLVADCGAYAGLAPSVMHVSATRTDNMHRNMNVRTRATLAYTHNPPHGAFRGYGGTQTQFAINSHLDEMARMLGLDPAEVHRINVVEPGFVTVHGWKIGSCGIQECITRCMDMLRQWQWQRHDALNEAPGQHTKRGVGMAAVIHVSGNRNLGDWDGATVVLSIGEDGHILVRCGEADMGQGAHTVIAQIVSHELDVPLSHVHVLDVDTDSSPWGIGTIASRVTLVAGNAALVAARAAKERLVELAASVLACEPGELECKGGALSCAADPARTRTMAELGRLHIWRHGGEGLQVKGTWDPDTVMYDKDLYGNVSPAYSFAAQAVEVEVDTNTGQVKVLSSCLADDCGKAINPLAVHGQAYGGMAQAIGWTLYENVSIEHGRIANGNLADYTMPTADALPHMQSQVVETEEQNGPLGAKGASETPILPGAAAIANAVFDAVGVRIRDLPITPEKVLAGLRSSCSQAHQR